MLAQRSLWPTGNTHRSAQWRNCVQPLVCLNEYRRDRVRLACVLCMFWLLPGQVLAHAGGLDASGCHTNRKTSEYHCHRSSASPNNRPVPQRALVDQRSRSDLGTCGVKYYCKQMTSCEEAVHYLVDCGLTRLDGDGDGIPCESLCGNW